MSEHTGHVVPTRTYVVVFAALLVFTALTTWAATWDLGRFHGGPLHDVIALAIAVALRCDDCIAFHVKAALQQGASRGEVTEALGMAIYMGAGPAVMYASHALDAFEQFGDAAKADDRAA